jgi:hypothetical protein
MFKFKKYRQWAEGLAMLFDGIMVQLRQAEYRLQSNDLSQEERIRLETLKKHCEYVKEQIKDIWEGKLHY